MKSTYIEPLNARAVGVLDSWLTAVGIESVFCKTPGLGLIATNADGEKVTVLVSPVEDGVIVPATAKMCADGRKLLGDLRNAINEFERITEALGHGKRLPVRRGFSPDQRLKFSENFDMIVFRHREFRAAPELSPEVLQKYRPIIDICVKLFYKHNKRLCEVLSYGREDLDCYAVVWTHNFHHKYRRLYGHPDENKKLLNYHLQQRFHKLHEALTRRTRTDTPEFAEFSTTMYRDDNITPGGIGPSIDPRGRERDEDYILEHKESSGLVGQPGEEKRRKAAKAVLAGKLESLTHDRLLFVLNEAAHSQYIDVVANEEARRQLVLHCECCPICTPVASLPEPPAPQPLVAPVVNGDPVKMAFDALPDTAKCPRCGETKNKSEFGMRVMKRDENGTPIHVSRQSYCRKCR